MKTFVTPTVASSSFCRKDEEGGINVPESKNMTIESAKVSSTSFLIKKVFPCPGGWAFG
jgi:hypothetical protein